MVEKTGGDVLLRQGEGEERGESCFLALRGMDAHKYKLNIAASRLARVTCIIVCGAVFWHFGLPTLTVYNSRTVPPRPKVTIEH